MTPTVRVPDKENLILMLYIFLTIPFIILLIFSFVKIKRKQYFFITTHVCIIVCCGLAILFFLFTAFHPNEYTKIEKIDGISALAVNKRKVNYVGNVEGNVYIENDDYKFVLIDENDQRRIITKPKYKVVIDAAPWVTENSVWEVETTVKYTTTNIWYYIPLNMDIPRKIIYVG